MSAVPNYSFNIYEYQDHKIKFQTYGYDLTGNTAKLQFRDAGTSALLLELSTSNAKIVLQVVDVLNGFITIFINSTDSLLLSSNAKWDLFVLDATGKHKALVQGGVCYNTSQTTF